MFVGFYGQFSQVRLLQSVYSTPAANIASHLNQREVAPFKIFGYALLVSLTNPKAILVGTFVFPLYIDENTPFLPQAIALGITAMLISFVVYLLYVLCAERLSDKLRRSSLSNKILGSIYASAGLALASINK